MDLRTGAASMRATPAGRSAMKEGTLIMTSTHVATSTRRRSARLALALGLLASLAIAGSGVADAATRTPLNTNLVVNPGAEAGVAATGTEKVTVPGWKMLSTSTVVSYAKADIVSPGNGGSKVFYCGANTNGSAIKQRIPLRGRNALIDSGNGFVSFTALIGVTGNQGDLGRLVVRFLDGSGKVLKSYKTLNLLGTTNSQMTTMSAGGAVPVGTRALRVELRGQTGLGPDCDVHFDNVDVRLSK